MPRRATRHSRPDPLVFTDPAWRAAAVDRDQVVRRITAQFRASMAEHVAEPVWKYQVRRLEQASQEFRELWRRHEVVRPSNSPKRHLNTHVGTLDVEHVSMWLGPRNGPRMVVYILLDAETRLRLERLHALAAAGTVQPATAGSGPLRRPAGEPAASAAVG